jgi:hypothetical protein
MGPPGARHPDVSTDPGRKVNLSVTAAYYHLRCSEAGLLPGVSDYEDGDAVSVRNYRACGPKGVPRPSTEEHPQLLQTEQWRFLPSVPTRADPPRSIEL